MSSVNYTEEQLNVITSHEKNLLVSASAGSGKTKVLVERIARIVQEEKVSLKNMLVVTFTNLASLEMKSRLKDSLEENIAKTNDIELKKYLQEQLNELNIANISTFHKFCQNIVKEFFYEVQLDPSFTLLDEGQAKFLKNKALDQTFEDYAQKQDDAFETLFEIFNENRNEQELKDSLLSTYSFLKSKSKDYFNKVIDEVYSIDLNNNKAINYALSVKDEIVDYFLAELKGLLLRSEQVGFNAMVENLNKNIQILNHFKTNDYEQLNLIFDSQQFDKLDGRKKFDNKDDDVFNCYKIVIDELKKQLKKISNCFLFKDKKQLFNNFEKNKEILNKYYEVLNNFENNYTKLKTSKNVLDFNDLEKYCTKIFENKDIIDSLQQKYKYIFIDEYQDTNEVQENLIQKLTNDNYIFMVGDIKQSIYMFRNCNPQIFINKYYALAKENQNQVIVLNKNFRSDKDILDFSNLVFNNVMKKESADIDYSDGSSFVFGEKFKRVKTDFSRINLMLLKQENKQKANSEINQVYSVRNDKLETKKDSSLTIESHYIAEKIKQLLNCEIYDNDLKANRKIEYKDIAILSKTHSAVEAVSEVFNKYHIPVNSEYKVNIYSTIEVAMIINLLKVMNNPFDDIALASSLKMIEKVSDNELSIIKQKYFNKFFYQNVFSFLDETNLTSDEKTIQNKIKALLDGIEYLKKFSLTCSVEDLIEKMMNYFNLESYILSFDDGEEKIKNIQYFIQQIKSIQANNIVELLNYLNDKKDEQVEITNKNAINSVYVGTIHSSKGLEYPVVFLMNAGKDYENNFARNKIYQNADFGLGLACYDLENKTKEESVLKNIIRLRIIETEKQEQMRLLYVGLTRAKCYLFVSGAFDKIEKLNQTYKIKQAKNYLDYILGSLSDSSIDKINNGKSFIDSYDDLQINIEVKDGIIKEERSSFNEMTNVDQELLDDYNNYHSYVFNKNDFSFKNSVTALMKLEQEENYNISDFKFAKSTFKKDDEDFALIGTNYHKVMQYINFEDDNIEAQLHKMEQDEILSKDELKDIDISVIQSAVKNVKTLIGDGDKVLREKYFMLYLPIKDLTNNNNSEKILIQGVIDLVIIKPDSIVLLDYKTTRLTNDAKLKEKYSLQLNIYAKALEKYFNKKVSNKIIYSFYQERLIIV